MADNDNPSLGKQFRGQEFAPIKTVEQVQADVDAQKRYDDPNGITLDVYFAMKLIRNPVAQAGMRAYNHENIQRATVAAWDEIFESF